MNKIKKKLLNKIKNTYCRIKTSKIEGVGVFAIRDIPKNYPLFTGINKQKWHKFKMSEFKNIDKEVLKMMDDFFVIEKDGSILIPEFGLEGMDISFFVNNSNKPNLKTADEGFNFKTLRKIKKGEELMVSYATYDYKYKK